VADEEFTTKAQNAGLRLRSTRFYDGGVGISTKNDKSTARKTIPTTSVSPAAKEVGDTCLCWFVSCLMLGVTDNGVTNVAQHIS
jgi:hypothetical protein